MTIYFVNSIQGSDAFRGNAPGCPFSTSGKIATSSFSGGDQILFARGGSYSRLVFPSAGGSGNPVRLGAYGSGPLPIFSAEVTDQSTLYCNKPYVEFYDLQINMHHKDGMEGILIDTDAEDNVLRGVKVVGSTDLLVTEESRGMRLRGKNPTVELCDLSRMNHGIQVLPSNVGKAYATIRRNTFYTLDKGDPEDGDAITINGVNENDCSGVVVSFNDVSGFLEDGIDLWLTDGVIVEHNYFHDPTDSSHEAASGIRGRGVVGGTNIIRYNTIENIAVTAPKANGIEIREAAYTVYGNHISGLASNNITRGISAWQNAIVTAYENVFKGAMDKGIYCNQTGDPPTSMTQSNNVFISCTTDVDCP